jgi:hypothetical protein
MYVIFAKSGRKYLTLIGYHYDFHVNFFYEVTTFQNESVHRKKIYFYKRRIVGKRE